MLLHLFENTRRKFKNTKFSAKEINSLADLAENSHIFKFKGAGDYFTLITSSYCGRVQISKNLEVAVIPKIYSRKPEPLAEFVSLLKFINFLPKIENGGFETGETTRLFEQFATLFLEALSKIEMHNYPKIYCPKFEIGLNASGKLQVSQFVKTGYPQIRKMTKKREELQIDPISIASIKWVLMKLSHKISDPRLKMSLTRSNSKLPLSIKPKFSKNIVIYVKDRRLNHYVRKVLKLALSFWSGDIGISSQRGSEVVAFGYVFDMKSVFQKLVARFLSLSAGSGVELCSETKPLFTLFGGVSRRQMPDHILRNGTEVCIFDSKWKDLSDANKADLNDLRQIFTYGHLWRANMIGLIYPTLEDRHRVEKGTFHNAYGDIIGYLIWIPIDFKNGRKRGFL